MPVEPTFKPEVPSMFKEIVPLAASPMSNDSPLAPVKSPPEIVKSPE